MAMAMDFSENSRFTDLSNEPIDHALSPIKGYEHNPTVPLIEALQPVSDFFNRIEYYAHFALCHCRNPSDNLTHDESASIYLYTMQFSNEPSLYYILNQSLRAEDREQLQPWFLYLKLFLTALHKLPSRRERVWRGVRDVDLSSKYKKGTKFVWWGVSSCTSDIEVLESNQLLGTDGQRTLFSIDCINGKSIIKHSHFKDKEKEIILMPGSYFEVIGQYNPSADVHIIQIKEILSPTARVKPPLDKSTSNTNSPVTDRKQGVFSQFILKIRTKSATWDSSSEEMSYQLNRKCKRTGVTIAGGNGSGKKLNQLFNPRGICIDDDQTLYIADFENDRIIEWKPNATYGRIVAGGNGRGNKLNQLACPTDVVIDQETNSLIIADRKNRRVVRWSRQNNLYGEIIISDIDCFGLKIDKTGSLYVSDCKKNEVRRWKRGDRDGTIVAGGHGLGSQLNQFNNPTFIFVDDEYSLYVADRNNHRIMKWLKDAKEGMIVAGGNGAGNNFTQLSNPYGVALDSTGQIYIAEWDNHRVMCWNERTKEGNIIVGGDREGQKSHQLNYPIGLSFDREDNLYVSDCWNNRVQKFEISRD